MINLYNSKFGILAGLTAAIVSLGGVFIRDNFDLLGNTLGNQNLDITSLMEEKTVLNYGDDLYQFKVDSLGVPYLTPCEVGGLGKKIIENPN